MYYFAKKYKRYDLGTSSLAGADPYTATAQAITGVMKTSGEIVDSFNPPNEYGNKPMGADLASTYLKNAGNPMTGPLMVAEYFKNRKGQRLEKDARFNEQRTYNAMQQDRSRTVLGNNPSMATGNVGADYYATGGPLSRNYLARTMEAEGGSLTPLSSDAVEVNGPSHEQGGVELPDVGAEVEGKETMQGDFVFSHRLGFAQEHAKLQRAIGRIEKKEVMTPERVNSIHRLQERSEKLKHAQEYLKHVMETGLQQEQPQS